MTITSHEDTRRILAEETAEVAKLPLPSKTFKEKMTLSFGGKTMELFEVKPAAHAEGLIAIRFIEDRTLYAVDVVVIESMVWMNLNTALFPETIESIKNLEALDFEHFASGHYRLGTKADMAEHRQYLEDLRDATHAAIDNGMSMQEAKASIKLEKYSHYSRYEPWLAANVEGVYRQLKTPEHIHTGNTREPTAHEDPNNTMEIAFTCFMCHGKSGISPIPSFPNLKGQKYDYLVKSMEDFRAKRRYESNMNIILPHLTKDEISRVAKYFSEINPEKTVETKPKIKQKPKFIAPISSNQLKLLTSDPNIKKRKPRSDADLKALITTGKSLAKACIACHGSEGIANTPTFPNIAGQKELYLSTQLKLMKSGERVVPEMTSFIEPLNQAELNALAAYYASLPIAHTTPIINSSNP